MGLYDNIYRETNTAKGTIDRNCAAVGRKVQIGDDNKQINIARFTRFTPGTGTKQNDLFGMDCFNDSTGN